MPNTIKGAARAKAKNTRVIKSLQREADRLGNFIAQHGDLPIGSPANDVATCIDVKILQQEIERLEQIVSRHEQSASGVPQLPSIEEIPMWFDVLRDLAVRMGDECPPECGNLCWALEKLAEKFGEDARRIVSAPIAQTKGGAA